MRKRHLLESLASILGAAALCVTALAPTDARAASGGFIFISGDDADDPGHCETASSCGSLFVNVFAAAKASANVGDGILAVGVNHSYALAALSNWNAAGLTVTHVRTEAEITGVTLTDYAILYIPSSDRHTSGGISSRQLGWLATRQAEIKDYANIFGGSIIALTEAGTANAWRWLPVELETEDTGSCPRNAGYPRVFSPPSLQAPPRRISTIPAAIISSQDPKGYRGYRLPRACETRAIEP
ncbi:MAG: hypothetical protein V3V08_12150 [Nannocystaceae bacterium]